MILERSAVDQRIHGDLRFAKAGSTRERAFERFRFPSTERANLA